jgi:hypothetical protein
VGVFANKSVWAITFLAALMLSCCFTVCPAQATNQAPSEIWNSYYGSGESYQWVTGLIQTSDDGYAFITRGNNRQSVYMYPTLYKVDSAGNLQWSKNTELGTSEGLVQTADGGYVVAGRSAYDTQGGSFTRGDVSLLKFDGQGNLVWNRTLSSLSEVGSMVGTKDGGYVLAGIAHSLSDLTVSLQVSVVKTDSGGNVEWNNTYGYVGTHQRTPIIQPYDRGYLLSETAWSENPSSQSSADLSLTKIGSDGQPTWRQSFSNPDIAAITVYSVAQSTDGGYAFFGVNSANKIVIGKTDAGGKMDWIKTFEDTYSNGFGYHSSPLVVTSDGGLAFCGDDGLIVKTDGFGNVEWNQTYTFRNDTVGILAWVGNCLIESRDGSLLLAGYGTTMLGTCYLVKVDAELPGLLTQKIIAVAVFVITVAIILLAYCLKNRTKK